jgi:hypothetical protein
MNGCEQANGALIEVHRALGPGLLEEAQGPSDLPDPDLPVNSLQASPTPPPQNRGPSQVLLSSHALNHARGAHLG